MPMTDPSTAPLPSDAHSDLRAEVADQAARLIADGGLDYQSAKQKALRRAFAGTTPPAGLVPTNEEIDRALREHLDSTRSMRPGCRNIAGPPWCGWSAWPTTTLI